MLTNIQSYWNKQITTKKNLKKYHGSTNFAENQQQVREKVDCEYLSEEDKSSPCSV